MHGNSKMKKTTDEKKPSHKKETGSKNFQARYWQSTKIFYILRDLPPVLFHHYGSDLRISLETIVLGFPSTFKKLYRELMTDVTYSPLLIKSWAACICLFNFFNFYKSKKDAELSSGCLTIIRSLILKVMPFFSTKTYCSVEC